MDSTFVQQLEQTGIDLLNFGKQSAQQLYAFLEKEAPQLLQEWLSWNFTISLMFFCLGFLTILIVGYFIYKASQSKWKIIIETDNAIIFAWVIPAAIAVPTIAYNLDWLQIWIAPRVWILENIKSLIGV